MVGNIETRQVTHKEKSTVNVLFKISNVNFVV